MNILLVEPEFPIPAKSKNHSHFLPIGLLKIASYHRAIGDRVALHRGNKLAKFPPDEIKITSLFTYWARYVWDSVRYYRGLYPNAKIEVGGIYASLMPDHAKQSGCDEVQVGFYRDGIAETFHPAYHLIKVDYQIVHASRGCFRKCNFCGTWKIENNVSFKQSIKKEIKKKKIIFYDNNLIANPFIKDILQEIAEFRFRDRSSVTCESQSGLDGRLLVNDPSIAGLLRKAKFKYPRIAWDGPYRHWPKIKEQIKILNAAGYRKAEIFIFMIFNHSYHYHEMKAKLDACRKWGVRVIDCRFRPLTLTEDNYNSRAKRQEIHEYYIHDGWNDHQVRRFRKTVRRQNIALMLGLPNGRYIEGIERKFIALAK